MTKQPSGYDFLRGRYYFTNEQWWLKLLLGMITVSFWVLIAYILRDALIVGFLVNKIAGFSFERLIRFFNRHSS